MNTKGEKGRLALDGASREGCEVARLLLENKADIGVEDEDGSTMRSFFYSTSFETRE